MFNLFDMLTVLYKYKKLYEKRCCGLMKKYGLRTADLDILFYIAHSGSRNLSKDIVDIGMSKANVSKSVDHLRKKELVTLSEDPEDRRCVHIETTESALSVILELRAIREDMAESLYQDISEEDRGIAVKVMRMIGDNANKELASEDMKDFREKGG